MLVVRVGEVENSLLEALNLLVHVLGLDVRAETREVVDSALTVRGGDNVFRVLLDVAGDLSPSGLNGGYKSMSDNCPSSRETRLAYR